MAAGVSPPDLSTLLAPILPALPAATISTEPAVGILPLLSPILRQRVLLFSASSTEPWLKLLCYDTARAAKLFEVVQSGKLEPHPVSGEVEVDWDYDAQTRYRRVDQETLQAFTVLSELGLAFQLVYCVGDAEGGGDGWRVGEITAADQSSALSQFGGASTITEAEAQFQFQDTKPTKNTTQANGSSTNGNEQLLDVAQEAEADDDDDGYWDRYDATPARTPAEDRPAPQKAATTSRAAQSATCQTSEDDDDDDDYYAQYDQVQPAMDNHDPDEEAQQAHIQPPLGLGRPGQALESSVAAESDETRGSWTFAELDKSAHNDAPDAGLLLHPRPESSASSNGSHTVARLEASAGKQEQNEFGVKQHVSRSIRSLYLLARSSGIEREEFERLVKTELDVLGMMQDQD